MRFSYRKQNQINVDNTHNYYENQTTISNLTFTIKYVLICVRKPNIVIVFMDNFGWVEPRFNGRGITRGAETPRMDKMADEGMHFTNFNVEAQCTPSRPALMTGRYSVRSGNGKVPLGEGVYGLVQWEVTIAEILSDNGYATDMFGKWHLGHTEGRFPTDQGFYE